MLDVGTRVRFKTERLPDQTIDPPGTDDTAVPWREHFGGLDGTVDASDPTNDAVRVRGKDRRGHPYTVWIAPRHLDVTQEV